MYSNAMECRMKRMYNEIILVSSTLQSRVATNEDEKKKTYLCLRKQNELMIFFICLI